MEKIGHWAFLLGVALAFITGVVPQWQTATMILALTILGLVVGILNVTAKETTEFLVAVMTLLLAGSAGALPSLGMVVTSVLTNIVAFVGPAGIVVALKAVWQMANE